MAFEHDDDSILPPSDDVEEIAGEEDVSILPPQDEEADKEESKEMTDDKSGTEETEDWKTEVKEDTTDKKETEDSSDQWEEDTLDLAELFKDVESMEEANKETSDIIDRWEFTPEDIKTLKENNEMLTEEVKSLKRRVEGLINDKTELTYANAEMKAFGGDSTNPQLIIINRNFTKALEGNEMAKGKTIDILRDMYEQLTGSSIDKEIVDKNADVFSQVEQYNSTANPNLKGGDNEEYSFTL